MTSDQRIETQLRLLVRPFERADRALFSLPCLRITPPPHSNVNRLSDRVLMKPAARGARAESLPSKIRRLILAHSAPTPEKRTAAF